MKKNLKLEQEIMNVCNDYLLRCNTTDRFKTINQRIRIKYEDISYNIIIVLLNRYISKFYTLNKEDFTKYINYIINNTKITLSDYTNLLHYESIFNNSNKKSLFISSQDWNHLLNTFPEIYDDEDINTYLPIINKYNFNNIIEKIDLKKPEEIKVNNKRKKGKI